MKVKDMIEKLSTLDPNVEVLAYHENQDGAIQLETFEDAEIKIYTVGDSEDYTGTINFVIDDKETFSTEEIENFGIIKVYKAVIL